MEIPIVSIFTRPSFFLFLLLSCSCLAFSPLLAPTPSPPQSVLPIVHTHESSIHVPLLAFSPSFPHYTPSPSPLVTVRLFFISKPLVLFCSFVCLVDKVPLTGEIIWHLSFTAWFISLSIKLSSSIHAVMKDGNSFFISAA